MWRILGAALLAVLAVHKPIVGDHSDQDFAFHHSSDWKDDQVVNSIKNDHGKDLVVDWPKAGICMGANRPIPAGGAVSNSYTVPEARLTDDLQAELFYGLSHAKKVAGVYELKDAVDLPAVLRSEIRLDTKKGRLQLDVISSLVKDEVVYSFVRHGEFDFFMSLAKPIQSAFNEQNLRMGANLFEAIPDARSALERGALGDSARFAKFQMINLPGTSAAVKIPGTKFRISREIIFFSDRESAYVGSGFVVLHAPAAE